MENIKKRIERLESATGLCKDDGTVCFDITDQGYLIDGKLYERLEEYERPKGTLDGFIFYPMRDLRSEKKNDFMSEVFGE